MSVLGVCEWLEQTRLAAVVQESRYGFPLLVAVHLLGLALSVGTLLWVDLRMTGMALRRAAVAEVYRALAPWFSIGFVLSFASGVVLFVAFASAAYGNTFFRLKMAALALAAVNAVVFHFVSGRARLGGDDSVSLAAVRVAGWTSIALWTAVILAGRMMSYTMF
jgi:hypothetical protein